jgi:catechol 2,3-dioxygenase-like lactoylglutathione lyase family enzyme
MEEVSQFEVTDELGGTAGLTDHRGFRVRVMQAPGEAVGTRIKLVRFSGAPRCCDVRYLHSVTGPRYLTLRVADIDAAVERLRAAGVEPKAHGPVEMPEPFKPGTWIAVVQDPEGTMIELIGPKAS